MDKQIFEETDMILDGWMGGWMDIIEQLIRWMDGEVVLFMDRWFNEWREV